ADESVLGGGERGAEAGSAAAAGVVDGIVGDDVSGPLDAVGDRRPAGGDVDGVVANGDVGGRVISGTGAVRDRRDVDRPGRGQLADDDVVFHDRAWSFGGADALGSDPHHDIAADGEVPVVAGPRVAAVVRLDAPAPAIGIGASVDDVVLDV